jgi:polysaccharide pyruvyl transferase WcaK-like protein
MVKSTSNNYAKFALIGGYGHGNLGDDALMLANVAVLSERIGKGDITVFIRQPAPEHEYTRRWLPNCNVQSIEQGEKICCENVIYGGGTMFRSFPGIRKNILWRAKELAEKCVANPSGAVWRVLRKKLSAGSYPKISAEHSFGLGIGIGPFMNNGSKIQQAKRAFQHCEYLSVRDSCSRYLCKRWNIDSAVLRADLCFCPELWGRTKKRTIDCRKLRNIGVIVRQWRHTKEGASCKHPLMEAVSQLRKDGCKVKYIFFQEEPSWDAELSGMEEDVLAYSPHESSVNEFVESLEQFDLIITARAHGAIFAATLGIPSICIEIEPKLRYICEAFGDAGKLWQQPFDKSQLLSLVEEISKAQVVYSQRTKAAAVENRRLAEQSIHEFYESLNCSAVILSNQL